MLDNILFIPNFEALFISYDDDSSRDLFQKKVQFAWEHFHPDLKDKYKVDTSRTNLLRLDLGHGNYSSFKVDSSGRSGTYQQLHVSELALIAKNFPEKVDKIIRGTFPCVHPPNGQIAIESTSEGPFGAFYEMCIQAQKAALSSPNYQYRPTEFKFHFYNWQWDVTALEAVTIPMTPNQFPKDFLDIQKKHNELHKLNPNLYQPLTDLQLTYFFQLWEDECKQSYKKLFLEYPLTPEMAFQKDSRAVFDTSKIQSLLAQATNPNNPSPREFKSWLFYEDINPSHQYILGADPSEGVQRDHSAAALLDITPAKPKVIATFMDNEIQPDIFAYELKNIAELANSAFIIVERNNSGAGTLIKLKDIYPVELIYKEERTNREDDTTTDLLGWRTTGSNKPKMFYDLSTAINENSIDIPSPQILKECLQIDRKFVSEVRTKSDTQTDDSPTSSHADLLTALTLAYQGRLQAMEDTQQVVITSNSHTNSDPFGII